MEQNNIIKTFKKEYSWLSNFSEVEINLRGRKFKSVEHAYMSEKNNSDEWKIACSSSSNLNAGLIKKLSKQIIIRADWDLVKFKVMNYCVRQKFKQEPFKSKLIATGKMFIQEGNYWGDKFWGVCLKTNEGDNWLGKIIMNIRAELQDTNPTK